MSNYSQWAKYNDAIEAHYTLLHDKTKVNWSAMARTILGEEATDYEVNLLRTYARRHLTKLDKIKTGSSAKVLLFDIETAPLQVYTWGKWQQNIQDDNIITDWFMFCWSAKWLFQDEVFSAKLTNKELKNKDDRRITANLWSMLDSADIIIAHNLSKFDEKVANTRFLKYRMGLPSPYQRIDTLTHARKKFKVVSNRLDYLGHFLGVGRKLDTPKGLWRRCMEADYEALTIMSEYCDQDVQLLEDVYIEMRPYIQPHPNMGLHIADDIHSCPTCGSDDLVSCGEYATYVNVFNALRCKSCGALSRQRKRIKLPNSNLTTSLPR